MQEFAAAFAVFIALHSIPAIPALRSRIISIVGRPAYFVIYSVISTAVLVWVFRAALMLDYIPLWDFRPWQAIATFVLAPVGIFLVIAGLLSDNPLSISLARGSTPGAIVSITRHPVLWGFFLWAAGHVIVNGDLRSLLLFGGFALFAIGGIPMAEKRAQRRLGAGWATVAAGTSNVPLLGALTGQMKPRFDMRLGVGALATTALVVWLLVAGHSYLFGTDPLSLLG
ncbi:NnrU family protein (plasmid) [Rhizobium sullae]|uniref:NnrU family protein n=1 Tax=Rhizobium sullae TaxID=50338 RepID=A0A2N0DC95_RHISU|nr:NnrU family protein [Rhizobium sullae]PKA43723.1 NnrU family protein [Rhizobium sullae]UWU18729.1 NnrU family protein [Rhizobium sullae]